MRRIALLVLLLITSGSRHVTAVVPTGFEDTVVASVASPTALAFTPDGRLLITTQQGQLRVHAGGALLPTPALNLSGRICTNSERGLLGVAVDPSFASNGFIYLYYTFNKSNSCGQNSPTAPVNRVSRFTLSTSNTVSLSSELILIDNIPSPNGNHNGGDVHVGRDGNLYISVGDGGCDYRGDSGCAGANDAARDRHVLSGKILRITRTGGIPAGNPFTGANSVRCNVTGVASPGQVCQETFAWGLRNPFRMAFDPNAAGTRFFINDVGQNAWEEIDEGVAGADYGWNVREGHCANGSTTNCGAPPAGMTNPIFDYGRSDGCAAITGGAFVPNGAWPSAYEGAYLFGDYVCGTIFRLNRQSNGTYTRTPFATNLGGSSAVAMIFGPGNALYYTTYAGGGQVRRIAPTTANRNPTASASASPTSGSLPLAVRFDGSASSDPDGDPLTYSWNFGDGSAPAATAIANHTYTTAGRYTATLTVRDNRGGSATANVVIQAGNRTPTVSIASPSATARFAVGQTITLTGSASDPEDGTIPNSRLSWTVLLHHNTHTHPYFGPTAGNNLTFQAPAPEDLDATSTSFLEIYLTATDSGGARSTLRRDMQPRLVPVTFESSPSNLTVTANGTNIVTPRTVTSWEGYRLNVNAPAQTDPAGESWVFSSWSDGGAAAHTIVTPAAAATYSATFARSSALTPTADAYVRNGASAAQNFGTLPEMLVKHSSAIDNQRQTFLRFNIGTRTVGRAVLRMYGRLSSAGTVPVRLHPVANTTWSETGITWNTRPTRGSTALATTNVTSTTPAWYQWDVSSYVRAERAAGRTTVSFVLIGTTQTTPYANFNSREASSNRPELAISAPATGGGDIVLYGTDVARFAGTWRMVADATAAGGSRINNPDRGVAKILTASAAPANFGEWTFNAEANRAYRLWIRGKADGNSHTNDSVHVQFSGSVTSSGASAFRIGTTSSTVYVLQDCAECRDLGWGWQDNGYGTGVLGDLIYFATTGPQTIRIQNREDGLSIDQIVLSPTTYLTSAPGATTNDTTIVAKP